MKKLLSILLAISLAASLAACGSSPSGSSDSSKKESPESKISSEEVPNKEPEKPPATDAVTLAEQVIVDDQGVKVTATGMGEDSLFGKNLKLLIENNTEQALTFQTRDASVNGYMVETMMSADVAAGKKVNDTLTFQSNSLEACGITTIADMQFSLHIFPSDSFGEKFLDTEPIQLKTSAAEGYTYTYDDSGDLAYDGNGIKIVSKGISNDDSIFGPGLILYLHNTTEQGITVQVRDVSVNGFMVDTSFSCDITAGKHAVDAITFLESDLQENGITKFSEVELSFHIFPLNEWGKTIVDTEPITLTFA